MWQALIARWRTVLNRVSTHPQRVWVISRHDDLAQQDIALVNEAELSPHYWQQRRRYSPSMIERIGRMRVGAVLELQLAEHCEMVMRVK